MKNTYMTIFYDNVLVKFTLWHLTLTYDNINTLFYYCYEVAWIIGLMHSFKVLKHNLIYAGKILKILEHLVRHFFTKNLLNIFFFMELKCNFVCVYFFDKVYATHFSVCIFL